MKVSGHLVPFPDSGAADLMSNNLELWVEADGSGQIRCQAHVFERTPTEITQPTQLDYKKPFIRLQVYKQISNEWIAIWDSIESRFESTREIICYVDSSGIFKSKLTNISGLGRQFTLEAFFTPAEYT